MSLDISLKYDEIAPRITTTSPTTMTIMPPISPPTLRLVLSHCWVA